MSTAQKRTRPVPEKTNDNIGSWIEIVKTIPKTVGDVLSRVEFYTSRILLYESIDCNVFFSRQRRKQIPAVPRVGPAVVVERR